MKKRPEDIGINMYAAKRIIREAKKLGGKKGKGVEPGGSAVFRGLAEQEAQFL